MQSRLEQLRKGFDPLTPIFVLVDPMVGEPLPGLGLPDASADATAVREEGWGRAIVPVELSKTVALPPHQHPYLVALHGIDDPLIDLTFDIAEEERLASQAGGLGGDGRAAHRIGGWLQSSMQHEELAALVSAMCRVNTDARTNATYLRLADRRVLDLLCHVAGYARVAHQFGRLQSWTYLDSCGQLRYLRSSSEPVEPLRLSRSEWLILEDGELLHRSIAQYLGESSSEEVAILNTPYRNAELAASAAKDAARRWPHRFINNHDKAKWATLFLLYQSGLQLPEISRLLDDAGSKDEPAEPLRYLYDDIRAIVRLTAV